MIIKRDLIFVIMDRKKLRFREKSDLLKDIELVIGKGEFRILGVLWLDFVFMIFFSLFVDYLVIFF